MKLVVQRVKRAKVMVGDKIVSKIGKGLFILIGIHTQDTEKEAEILAEKLLKLRVMPDDKGKMNLSVRDASGSVLIVPQFTLYADTKGANRPNFNNAAGAKIAQPLYEYFVEKIKESKGINVQKGAFGEHMDIYAELDGPVTLVFSI